MTELLLTFAFFLGVALIPLAVWAVWAKLKDGEWPWR